MYVEYLLMKAKGLCSTLRIHYTYIFINESFIDRPKLFVWTVLPIENKARQSVGWCFCFYPCSL